MMAPQTLPKARLPSKGIHVAWSCCSVALDSLQLPLTLPRLSGLGKESFYGLCIGIRFFQHWQVSGILKPLDPNYARDVVGEPLRNFGSEILVVSAPEDQGWTAEAPNSIHSSHRLEIVIAVQLPAQKTAQTQPPFRSRHVWSREARQNFIVQGRRILHCDSVYPALRCARAQEETEKRGRSGIDDQLYVKALACARPLVVRLSIGEDNGTEQFGMIFHHQLANRRAVVVANKVRAFNPEAVHQPNYHVDLVRQPIVVIEPYDCVAESEKVRHDYPVAAGQDWDRRCPDRCKLPSTNQRWRTSSFARKAPFIAPPLHNW